VANVFERKDRREEFSVTAAAGLLFDEGVVPKPSTDDESRLSAMMHSERGEQDDGIVKR